MTAHNRGMVRRAETVWMGTKESTPLGRLWVGISERGLVAVDLLSSESDFIRRLEKLGFGEVIRSEEKTHTDLNQICEYLLGVRREFDFSIDWSVMTGFKESVLRATYDIPYGKTSTYRALASQVGRPQAARAVGRAEATNPMPIVVPCHRVLGSDGLLHGYGAGEGLATKSWLLELERGQSSVLG